ncbi:MAG: 30S ribosomal protein S4e [Thermocladium sp.]
MTHLRRSMAPGWWPLEKGYSWAVKPNPGPHGASESLPLGLVLRDLLGYVTTLQEARRVLGAGYVKVDGKTRRDYKYPVGAMDVIELVPTGELFRVLPDPVKFLRVIQIQREEANVKIRRIENKTSVRGGKVQLNFNDGTNLVISDAKDYGTLGSVLFSLSEGKILDYIPITPGNYALIFRGSNAGRHGVLKSIIQTMRRREAIVSINDEGTEYRTILDHVLMIGKDSPMVRVN